MPEAKSKPETDSGNWRDEDSGAVAAQYESAGIRRRLGFGKHPAIVVVDLSNAFTGGEHPLSSNMDDVVEPTLVLLEAARAKDVPIYFTTISYADESGPGTWALKSPVLNSLVGGGHDTDIDPRLKRQPGEGLVVKPGASSFFATNLATMLTSQGVDTVIVTGGSTSGCVRATVVDAIQLGFRPIVPEECVGDRAEGPHKASLIDMDGKYGDVLPLDEVLNYVRGLPDAA